MNIEELPEELRRLEEVLANGELFTRQEAETMRKGFSANFTRQGSPDSPWPPRKNPKDGGRSKWPGHPLLIDLGDLYGATAQTDMGHIERVAPRSLDIGVDGTKIKYAFAQNYGYAPRNLPPREFLVVEEAVLRAIDNSVADRLLAQLLEEV